MLLRGHGGRGRHTWFLNINYTRGLAPFPHSLRERREGGVGETDLVEAGDGGGGGGGGLEAVSMGSPAWREDDLLRPP